MLVGLALALGLGLALAYGLLIRARQDADGGREQRQDLISLNALVELAQRAGGSGDGVRSVVAAVKDQLLPGRTVRVIAFSGIQLEASTFPADQGDKAAPRRLSREEKPLYDRGQRLRAAVETNREEGNARKPEIERAELTAGEQTNQKAEQPTGALLFSAPIEVNGSVVGMVDLATPPRDATGAKAQAQARPGMRPVLLAFFLPLLLLAAVSLAPLRRQWQLVAVAAVAFVAGLGGYARYSMHSLEEGVRGSQEAVARHLNATAEKARAVISAQNLAAEPALKPDTWDTDFYRRSLGILTAQGTVTEAAVTQRVVELQRQASRAFYLLGALGLGLLLFIGLGGMNRLAATVVEHREAYAYIMPAMVGMVVLVFFPFFYGITLSFTDANLYNTNQPLSEIWIGLRNYAEILGDFNIARRGEGGVWVFNYLNFYWTLFFTVVWTITNVAIGVSVGLLLALILNTPKPGAAPPVPGAPHPALGHAQLHHRAHLEGHVPPAVRRGEPRHPHVRRPGPLLVRVSLHLVPHGAGHQRLAELPLHDGGVAGRAAVHPHGALRGGARGRGQPLAAVRVHHPALAQARAGARHHPVGGVDLQHVQHHLPRHRR